MRITISGKNFNVSEKVEERLTRKLNKMDRYFGSEVEAQARLSLEKNNRNICEVTIPIEGGIVRAEESAEDMFKAIDRCLEKLERQIRKYRTKLEKRLKDGAFAAAPEYFTETEGDEESDEKELVRTKTFPVRPMAVEDAIAQMQLLGHSFFVFKNLDTDSVCVVYVRHDGNYGLLQPEYA
ncbi:MAG: ribosome-associated translation inhibitor RaiA [Clostridiales bacterium]|nr:ribosome-associated translation inhibitor RaiA [Clostridiales bacterium]MDY4200798.1 ribosome-associated translation inhibitor RaiA [Candidatus Fimadaptatus sp.]